MLSGKKYPKSTKHALLGRGQCFINEETFSGAHHDVYEKDEQETKGLRGTPKALALLAALTAPVVEVVAQHMAPLTAGIFFI